MDPIYVLKDADSGLQPAHHMETGKGTPPIVMHFQLGPEPLAK